MAALPLFQRATQHASRPVPAICHLWDGAIFTYGALLQRSLRLATELQAAAGQADLQGQRVAYLADPSVEYVVLQWAIWAAGGVSVPLSPLHPPPELQYVLEDSQPCLVLATATYRDRVQGLAADRRLPLLVLEDCPTEGSSAAMPPEAWLSRGALILYTSGTTGKPKGVVHTHASLTAQVQTLCEVWQWSSDDVTVHVLPLHHIHGLVNVLTCALWAGATCQFFRKFDATKLLLHFCPHDDKPGVQHPTVFMAVPTIYAKLLAAFAALDDAQQQRCRGAMMAMRLMVSGSAALPVATLKRWAEASGHILLERYGMSEIGMALSNPLDTTRRIPGTVGVPLPGVEVRIVVSDEAGEREAQHGESGELRVKGPCIFQEYWNRPQATAESFDANGYFRTGDCVQVGGDAAYLQQTSAAHQDALATWTASRGCQLPTVVDDFYASLYHILGRNSTDIIKSGGYKISALEVEGAIMESDAILECAVVGVPDEEWGERVAACVVLRDPSANFSQDAVRNFAKGRLAGYKAPSLVRFAEQLPRNHMGKTDKRAVLQMFSS
eukprot:GGOE01049784.1.p1 GENE.GGOE01049784.1~~GGOE01049784.1.p1  ORF type:complete len:561 (-),score=170.50 GGOE01049784.1:254-1915(-)